MKQIYLKQAFCTAGQAFHVIDDTDGTDVVVPYAEAGALLEELRISENEQKRKMILRKLQCFTVHLSNAWVRKLGNAVYGIEGNRFFVLSDGYYSLDTGVVEHPAEMPLLDF